MTQTLGEMIFGTRDNSRIYNLLLKEGITEEEAREVIRAVENPEIKRIFDDLQACSQNKQPRPTSYELMESLVYPVGQLQGAKNHQEARIMMASHIDRMFLLAFYRLIERAHLEYGLLKTSTIEAIVRKDFCQF